MLETNIVVVSGDATETMWSRLQQTTAVNIAGDCNAD